MLYLKQAQDSARAVAGIMILSMYVYGTLSWPWVLRERAKHVARKHGHHRRKG